MIVMVIAFHGRLFQRSVHSLDLAVGPGMVDFGQTVLNSMFATNALKVVLACVFVLFSIGELHTIAPSETC